MAFIVINMEIQTPRKSGRPRAFDRDAALHAAMLQFWAHGYEATSLHDLTTVMKITPPSLYAAFGNKKQLFLAAVDLYLSGPITSEGLIERAASGKDAARALLHAAVIGFTGNDTPRGCLLASAALSCSAAAADVQAMLAARRRQIEIHLARRIAADLPATEAADLAAHTMAVIQGMSTAARDGASRDKLRRIAETALRAWL